MMVFFSNAIKNIETYVTNWTRCPAANIYWFLLKKGCNQNDIVNMLTCCFSPQEVVKISNISFDGTMVMLKQRMNLDMTLVIKKTSNLT